MKEPRIRESPSGVEKRERGEAVGIVFGNVGSARFKSLLTKRSVREMDYLEADHPEEGRILCQVEDIELKSNLTAGSSAYEIDGKGRKVSWKRIAKVSVIGKREGRKLCRPLTPINPSSNLYVANGDFIREVLGLYREEGAYVGKIMHTDVDVLLDPSKLVQNHVSVVAKSGSGKSYTCGILIEELCRLSVPVVVLDLHGEYGSLISPNLDQYEDMDRFGVSPEGLGEKVREFSFSGEEGTRLGIDIRGFRSEELLEMMGIKNIGIGTSILYNAMGRVKDILGNDWELADLLAAVEADHNPHKWNVVNGLQHLMSIPVFSESRTPLSEIVEPGSVSVIDLKDVSLDIQQIGVTALLRSLFQARKGGKIPPFMLVVEEAHNFCPQSGPSVTSRVVRNVASEGRKFGMGLTVVTQRPAKVDKNVLSQCGTQIIMKVTNPNDLKSVISSVEGLDSRMADEIQRLPVSVGIVVGGNISNPVLVEMRVRRTKHGGDAVDILGNFSN